MDRDILEWRKKYPLAILPAPRRAMETRPELEAFLPTWRSLSEDYLSELAHSPGTTG